MNTEKWQVYSRSWFDKNKNQVSYIVFCFFYIYMGNLADVAFMQILFFVDLFFKLSSSRLEMFWL